MKAKFYRSPDDGGGTSAAADQSAAQNEVSQETAEQGASEKETPEQQRKKQYSEADMAKLRSEFETNQQAAIEKAVADALAKAQMAPDEKAAYEAEQKQEELRQKEQELNQKQLRLDTLDLLSQQDLDKDFLEYVLGGDLESTGKRIAAFKPLFDQKVQAQVEVRLAGKTPPAGGNVNSSDAIRDIVRKNVEGSSL